MNAIGTPQNHAEEARLPPGDESSPSPTGVTEAEVPLPRSWKPLGIGVSIVLGVAVVGVLVWKFLSYAPFVLPSAIALGHIFFKDWNGYKPAWKRWPIVGIVLAAGMGGVAYQSHQLQEKATAAASNERLQAKVDATLAAQKNTSEVFANSFTALSRELGDLKTRVATEPLRKEITSLQSKLEDTQKALAPRPKATLEFTFAGFKNPQFGEAFTPIREITLPATTDGIVKVPITVVNPSNTDAMQGHLNVFICDDCKFAKEPPGMTRLSGMKENVRDLQFLHILASESLADMTLEVLVPRSIAHFQVGVQYRCTTCVLRKEATHGIVHVKWDFSRSVVGQKVQIRH